MNATLTITSVVNIRDKRVVDNEQVSRLTYNWEELVPIYDEALGERKLIEVCRLSLYDHLLLINGEQYKVLHMLSKGEV